MEGGGGEGERGVAKAEGGLVELAGAMKVS